MQYSTLRCSEVRCSVVQHVTVQCSTVRYGAVQCSTVRYGTVRYRAVQHENSKTWNTKMEQLSGSVLIEHVDSSPLAHHAL